ncbi:hypothetical protein PQ472_05265 [Lacticaseibacillus pabuli]|uniref:Uncharacterized protein n=1 Tax=Lacticaseibacillus pabuli TaxID=3025672 RepID=A0ABY7WXG3_9LACO|nr:hypothetical protein [Lacticaseibacillus sp. KACC 23028]WDF83647.1 hypothetical protein PQ472_05265 [Lacticaseibacillus sp. KACC 23028]
MPLYLSGKRYGVLYKDGTRYSGIWLNEVYYPLGSGYFFALPVDGEDGYYLSTHQEERKYLPVPEQGVSRTLFVGPAKQSFLLFCPDTEFTQPADPNVGGLYSLNHHYLIVATSGIYNGDTDFKMVDGSTRTFTMVP